MIWGLSTSAFASVHVVIRLVGIVSGLVVLFGLLGNRLFRRWNTTASPSGWPDRAATSDGPPNRRGAPAAAPGGD